jgi:hypothetical protein
VTWHNKQFNRGGEFSRAALDTADSADFATLPLFEYVVKNILSDIAACSGVADTAISLKDYRGAGTGLAGRSKMVKDT